MRGLFLCSLMPLPYRPQPGEILICSFDDVACGAEMIKRRPVVVVSCHQSHRRNLCTVVPLSTTAPTPVMAWHHPLPHLSVTGWKASAPMWAKCDMLATVSFVRLNQPYLKSRSGGRRFVPHALLAGDLAAIRKCIQIYLIM